jgi:hypothetical protein
MSSRLSNQESKEEDFSAPELEQILPNRQEKRSKCLSWSRDSRSQKLQSRDPDQSITAIKTCISEV